MGVRHTAAALRLAISASQAQGSTLAQLRRMQIGVSLLIKLLINSWLIACTVCMPSGLTAGALQGNARVYKGGDSWREKDTP